MEDFKTGKDYFDTSVMHGSKEQISLPKKSVVITVDATKSGKILKHVWPYYGFDEANFATEPDCISLMKTVAEVNSDPVYLRQHFLLNSGDGKAYRKWGSTNVYTEDEDGRPVYSWKVMDTIMDAIIASGCLPLVEIGFMPQATLGGPHIAGARNPFLKNFLKHCDTGINHVTGQTGTRLDYIGFHAKGGTRWVEGHVWMNLGNQLRLHMAGFSTIAEFPKFINTPIIIGEADPDGCAACPSETFPERGYRNSPAYGAYVAAMMKYSMDLAEQYQVNLKGIVTWAFMFADQPLFYGFRTLSTNGVHKPVLNVFKMLGQFAGNEIPLTSTASSDLEEIVSKGFREKADINGIATKDEKAVRIIIWNYHDDLVPVEPNRVELKVTLPTDFGQWAKFTQYRVDSTHSNAYTKWLELGRPQNPRPQQIAQLKEAMQLQMLEPVKKVSVKNQQVSLKFDLPRHAVSLIVLEKSL